MNFYPELNRGEIVYTRLEQTSGPHQQLMLRIEVEQLDRPVLRGASLRTHRLWENGRLAGGGAWRHSLEDAIAQADYLVIWAYGSKLSLLNTRVSRLEAQNAQLKAVIEALKEQREYTGI